MVTRQAIANVLGTIGLMTTVTAACLLIGRLFY